MDAFIINLSNIFDFDISMPVLSGLIAQKRIWISKDSSAFPVNPSETLVNNKLFEFSNKYEHMRITLDVSKSSAPAQLCLILGYEEWDFLPYGRLSAYPLFKIRYIQNKLSELFKKPIKSLPFKIRIFLTPQAHSDRQDFFNMLEEKGFVDYGANDWFTAELIENKLGLNLKDEKNILAGKKAEDLLDAKIRKSIDQLYDTFARTISEYAQLQCISNETLDLWQQNFKSQLDAITTIQVLSKIISTPTALIKSYLYTNFSVMANINALPPIYKYEIDTSSTANGLRDKFEYTQFILQFIIDPFIEEKNRFYKVEEIDINRASLSPILNKLYKVIDVYKKNTIDLEQEVDYHVYSVNDSYYRNLPTVDNGDRNQFYNLNSVRNILGSFYSRDKKDDVLKEFARKSFSKLENKIPVETGSFTSLLKEALNKQTKSTIVRMVPSEIIRFEQSRLASPIDFKKYTVERDRLLQEEQNKINELIKAMPDLPFIANVMITIFFVVLIMILFALPVFDGEYWGNLLYLIPAFILTTIGISSVILWNLRRKVHNLIRDIEEVRLALAGNLAQHCSNIKEAATQMANAFANRETLKSLKKIQKKYNEKSFRYLAYENFHAVNNESINRLSKIYGLEISNTIMVSAADTSYDKHPEDDLNLAVEFPVNDLDVIINQQQMPKMGIRTIIKKIRLKYLA